MKASSSKQSVLPPVNFGRPPIEYQFMEQAQELLEAFKGPPDELLSGVTVAKGLRTNADWPRMAAASGRGPKATKCGRLTMFRRGDVVAWLRELAKAHKATKRRAG